MSHAPGVALTNAQRELVLSSMLAPGTGLGLTGGTMHFTGPLDAERYIRVVDDAVRNCDALALRFELDDGQILQSPTTQLDQCMTRYMDLAGLPNPESLANTILNESLLGGCDLFSESPPVRNFLFKLGHESYLYSMIAHHAQIDGWGFSVWVQYLAKAYSDEAATLPPFLEFVKKRLERDAKNTHLRQRSVEYWLEKMPSAPAPLFAKSNSTDFTNDLIQGHVTPQRCAVWRQAAEQANVSMAAFATAAVLQELAKLTGQPQPVLGLSIHNRPTPTAKATVGLFAGVQPLSVPFDRTTSTADLADRILQTQRSDFRHSSVSVGDLRKAWGNSNDAADPLDVTFSFELHDYDTSFSDVEHECRAFPPKMQSRPVQIYWREYHENEPVIVDLCVRHGTLASSFGSEFLDRVFARLDAASLGEDIAETDADVQAIQPASIFLPKTSPQSEYAGLWDLFVGMARQNPDKLAVTDEHGKTLTYQQLKDEAIGVAQHLRQRGVGPETLVGLATQRNAMMLVGVLGILAAGGAYVPLDPSYPKDRIDYLIGDSGVSIIVADAASASQMDLPHAIETISLPLAHRPTAMPVDLPKPRPDSAAYVIYTSGSTGQPKGCVINHSNVLSLLASIQSLHGYTTKDVWSLFHSYAFDFAVWEIWGAFSCGGTLVVVSADTSRDPESFVEFLVDHGVTVLCQTPTAFRSLLAQIEGEGPEAYQDTLKLRQVIFGGEALSPAMLAPWFKMFGERTRMTNMYGITETTVHVTHRDIRPADVALGSVMGPPLPNWSLYVLDEDLNPCKAGETGEMYVGGEGVLRGYHNRARLTAERVLPDPFRPDGGRMYRSGDLAQVGLDGEIIYVGRIDHQVKIRGFRIELGEVEAALRTYPSVADAVVLARALNGAGEQRLVAWVTPYQGGALPEETDLRAHLSQTLPAHMIPAQMLVIDKLPMTTNGKLDKDALPNHAQSVAKPPAPSINQQSLAVMAKVWSDVLGRDVSDPNANFFSLGGDSILALRVLSQLRRVGLDLELADIYRDPTLSQCAARMRAVKDVPPPVAKESAPQFPDGIQDAFPMMSMQGGMMYHSQMAPDSAVFHDVFAFDLALAFDPTRMKDTLQAAAKWTPALRTSFDWLSDLGPSQLIHDHAEVPLAITDLRALSEADRASQLRTTLDAERRVPFDFAKAPLVRLKALITGDSSFRLMISFHHAVMDGWSLASLVAALLADYQGLQKLEDRTRHDDVQRLACLAETRTLEDPDKRAFWQSYAQDIPTPLNFGPKNDHPAVLAVDADVALSQALSATAKSLGVSLKTLTLGVHLQAQMRLRGQSEIATGYVANCRPETAQADEAIGMFLNTVPLQSSRNDQMPLTNWLQQLAAAEAEVLEHRHMPLVEILKISGARALFDCAFNYVHFHIYNQLLKEKINVVTSHEVFEQTDLPLLVQFGVTLDTGQIKLTLVSNCASLGAAELHALSHVYLDTMRLIADASQGSGTLRGAAQILPTLSEIFQNYITDALHDPTAADRKPRVASGPVPVIPESEWTADQIAVADIWETVLQVRPQNLHQHFYELGGDSISATRTVALIRKATDAPLTVKDFLADCTINAVAQCLAQARDVPSTPPAGPKRVARVFQETADTNEAIRKSVER